MKNLSTSLFKKINKKSLDKFDAQIDKVVCVKCGRIFLDSEPFGYPDFHHTIDPKNYCPNEGKRLYLGTPGVASFRSKKDRRARKRGAKKAGKLFRKNK